MTQGDRSTLVVGRSPDRPTPGGPQVSIPERVRVVKSRSSFSRFLMIVLVSERVPSTVWLRGCFAMPPPPFSPLLSLLLFPKPRGNGPQRDLHAHERSQSRENRSTDNRNGTVPTRFSLDKRSGVRHSRPRAIASAQSPNDRHVVRRFVGCHANVLIGAVA